MQDEIDRLTKILSEHLGMSAQVVTLLAVESYLTKRNGGHLLRPGANQPAKPPRLPNGTLDFTVLAFDPVPNSNIHNLIVCYCGGEHFAFKCAGGDWVSVIRDHTLRNPDGGIIGGTLKLVTYGGRPTKFWANEGAPFPLDPIPLPARPL